MYPFHKNPCAQPLHRNFSRHRLIKDLCGQEIQDGQKFVVKQGKNFFVTVQGQLTLAASLNEDNFDYCREGFKKNLSHTTRSDFL